jgi:hypothetical protein
MSCWKGLSKKTEGFYVMTEAERLQRPESSATGSDAPVVCPWRADLIIAFSDEDIPITWKSSCAEEG